MLLDDLAGVFDVPLTKEMHLVQAEELIEANRHLKAPFHFGFARPLPGSEGCKQGTGSSLNGRAAPCLPSPLPWT